MFFLQQLIDKAKKNNNKLSYDEINKLGLSDEDLDNLFYSLIEHGIVIDDYTESNFDNNCSYLNDLNEVSDVSMYSKDSLALYLTEINKFPVLTKEQEKELFIEYKNGNKKIKEYIINCNLKFVVYFARKSSSYRVPLIDLIQEGNIGLIKAIDKFDVTKNIKFSSYASYWIKQAICSYKNEKSYLIRYPMHASIDIKKIKRLADEYEDKYGKYPDIQYITTKLNLSEDKVKEYLNSMHEILSLDSNITDDSKDSLIDIIVTDDREFRLSETKIDCEKINKIMKEILTEREYKIIILIYFKGKTLQEIGKIYGIKRQRVNIIEKNALKKIKRKLIRWEM